MLCSVTLAVVTYAADQPQIVEKVGVFDVDKKFGGWPANHGMWIWDNEILVGFSIGDYKDLGRYHNIDREKPEHHVLVQLGRRTQLEARISG